MVIIGRRSRLGHRLQRGELLRPALLLRRWWNRPYARLKRALKADIDEAAWATLYDTTSRPFPRPSSGKIAVKVINHYGDEVLKVYEV